jgi:hypothetical protein
MGDAYYTTLLPGRPVGQVEACTSVARMDGDLATSSPGHAFELTKEAMYVQMPFYELILHF